MGLKEIWTVSITCPDKFLKNFGDMKKFDETFKQMNKGITSKEFFDNRKEAVDFAMKILSESKDEHITIAIMKEK